MPKASHSPFTPDSPEWTSERQLRSVPFTERFPKLANAAIKDSAVRKRRGLQKSPTKRSVTIRLSPEVVDALKATGRGWQGRADEVLRVWAKTQPSK